MKSINKIWGILLTAFLLVVANPAKILAQPGETVSFQTFYDELQPYGTWVDDPNYGSVWIPDAEDGFQPYATNGHWVVTEYGNTWVSDYEWGWAPFHYGRWRYDDYYGWEWIPGSEWGPAWVNWRTGGDYYAWAPMAPGVSIDISFGGYNVPNDYWICAPRAYITSPRIYDYYVPRTRVVNIIRNTTIINNVYVNNNRRFVSGPRPQDIERYTNRRVDIYRINNSNNPRTTIIQNNTVNIYRPTVIRNNNNGGDRPRPSRVVDATAYRNAHPNEGIANRSNGATINHTNATRLAQTARDPQAQNSNIVRVNNRPGVATTPNGNNPGNNNNGRPATNGNQPGISNPTSNPNANPSNNYNGRFNRNGNQNPTANPGGNTNPNNGRPTRPDASPANPTGVPNNNNPVNPTTNNNGRFNRNRDQPSSATPSQRPAVTQPQQQQTEQQRQQQVQQQQAEQQRQRQAQQSQQQRAEQIRQQQAQQSQQADRQRQQQAQPQQQRPQAQPQQQRPQAQPQQQRPQAQPQQQRPQVQRAQPRPQPEAKPERKEDKPASR
ncbi:DUF6600 domain-containing protein [Mucilaginibacter paludis]|uniref:Uncharacterized protein n=1 Tax=Mucilaginibacter paludis DSM 18603 TaxID=714943 RepID=H1Y4B7_9SPHI|nr:DUF6600 domain-containing protein [Mucilaginibacter paludis]EHQ25751.1 hypothetical protein Mucpa_1593 [Mucilaginibacter paludis DSM 18603]